MTDRVGFWDLDGVGGCVRDEEVLLDPLSLGEIVRLGDIVLVEVLDDVLVFVADGLRVALRLSLGVIVLLGDPDVDCDCDGVDVSDDEPDWVILRLWLVDKDDVAEDDGVPDAVDV